MAGEGGGVKAVPLMKKKTFFPMTKFRRPLSSKGEGV